MFVLFEEAAKFMTGRLVSEAETSVQVELDSGKRVKVKSAHILLRFEQPRPEELLARARALNPPVELPLAWEFAPAGEFGFADLAHEYFGSQAQPQASLAQQVGMLFSLFEAPHYFRRVGKGRFHKAPLEAVTQALAAIEKKQQVTQQIDAWAQALSQGQCPLSVREQLYKILFKPDKNAPEYKAVVAAARATQLGPLALLQRSGAVDSAYQFHWRRFLLEHFPQGVGFPELAAPAAPADLPLATAQAFSIDDSATTEIDDALSVQGLGSGEVTLGIHIAAPGLAVLPGSAVDQLARRRLSTVYMPGHKITMLPDAVVQNHTLQAGRATAAVSLYVTLDETSLVLRANQTRLERVFVSANLRYDRLDQIVTESWLQTNEPVETTPANATEAALLAPLREAMVFLFRFAQHLKAGREAVRGRPENTNRPDYSFQLLGRTGAEPNGEEAVHISQRRRGAPLDLMVAETMILANSLWGQWLAELGVPGIYRSQASLAPGAKVRMGALALPHAGIGVKSYAWSTSPLRRYTDLVNQWQIIACVRRGKTAALAAPFKAKDVELLGIIASFEATYSAYNEFQNTLERFWTLKYLQQQGITELTACVFKDKQVRAEQLPLVLSLTDGAALPRGARVRVKLGQIDEILLHANATVLERLDTSGGPDMTDASDTDEDEGAQPLSLAVQVDDTPAPAQTP